MAVNNYHKPHSVQAFFVPIAETELTGIRRVSIRTNTEVETTRVGTTPYPTKRTQRAVKPSAEITTSALQQWLSGIGYFPICFSAPGPEYGIRIYSGKRDCAGVEAGSVHSMYTISEGIITPSSLRANHQEDAELTFQINANYDGTTDPLIVSHTEALPTTVEGDTFRFDKVVIESLVFGCKKSVEIDWGVNTVTEGCDNEQFDTFAGVDSVEPRITIRGIDISWFDTLVGLTGVDATHANTTVWFKKNGFDDVDNEHIKITAAGLLYIDQVYDGDATGRAPASITATLETIETGGVTPLVMTFNQPIT